MHARASGGADIQPATLTTQEAARYLGIGLTRLYELIKSGELESFKLGRRRLIPRRAVDQLIDTLTRA